MLGFFNRILDLVYIELDVFIVGHRRLTYIHLRDEIRGRWEKIIFFKRDITSAPSSMLYKHEMFTNAILAMRFCFKQVILVPL